MRLIKVIKYSVYHVGEIDFHVQEHNALIVAAEQNLVLINYIFCDH